jgi:hypothetical protein
MPESKTPMARRRGSTGAYLREGRASGQGEPPRSLLDVTPDFLDV